MLDSKELRHMTTKQRVDWLVKYAGLTDEESKLFGVYGVTGEGKALRENSIGTYHGMTLGIVQDVIVNDRNYVMLMAIEEPSVIASQNYMNRIISQAGGYQAEVSDPWEMISQIQLVNVKNKEAIQRIRENKDKIIKLANEKDPLLVKLGGGARDLDPRYMNTKTNEMLIVELYVDTKDAMGANACNSMAEGIASYLEELTGGEAVLKILTNFAERRLASSKVKIPLRLLDTKDYPGLEVAKRMVMASDFANVDYRRATTSNKGIMNGIDAIAIAYGQDFRALEAGAHSYAFFKGSEREGYSLTDWKHDSEFLYGKIEMPCAVGIVGGASKMIPQAKVAMEKVSKIKSADELAKIIVSMGLAQNMAAIRALSTEGINRGHMRLHARNIAVQAGATGEDIDRIAETMIKDKKIREDYATELLKKA